MYFVMLCSSQFILFVFLPVMLCSSQWIGIRYFWLFIVLLHEHSIVLVIYCPLMNLDSNSDSFIDFSNTHCFIFINSSACRKCIYLLDKDSGASLYPSRNAE